MKLTRKIIFAVLIGLSLFGAASAVAGATHASAATAIEYGLITALIAVALIAILSGLGSQMSTVFSEVSSATK